MSHTEGYTARKTYDMRAIRHIANRAKNMIRQSIEFNPTVIDTAVMVIDDFVDTAARFERKLKPLELISEAREMSAPRGIQPSWEYQAGTDLAEIALKCSFDVATNQGDFNDGRQQLNRAVRKRSSEHKKQRHEAKLNTQRSPKPSIPTQAETNRWGGTKRSPKQRYHHGGSKRRRAA